MVYEGCLSTRPTVSLYPENQPTWQGFDSAKSTLDASTTNVTLLYTYIHTTWLGWA